ncbi:hypothetical protein [Amycolatopsis pittospori]|uniref:hypothetical protein n=1 Tax=Amycolatopsis pittospori TaxID=2749434 RepID=UPI0015EFEFD0|nr:hypothetical protein [Amycolatopsis pittospori]
MRSRAHLTFETALRSAIVDSGLTLHAVQGRLARRGVQVAVGTLSSWQTGLNRPERAESLRAVAALEELFTLAPGALTALLGPRRPRGRLSAGGLEHLRFDAVPGGPAVAKIIGEICPEIPNDVKVLQTEEEVVLAPGRVLYEIRTRFLAQAGADGVDRCFAVNLADRAHDLDTVQVKAVLNCRPGRVRRDYSRWLVGTELLLDRVYNTGETFLIEYSAVIDQPIDEDEYFRAFARSVGLYVLRVQFASSELPVRCYQFRTAHADEPRAEQEIHLTNAHFALMAAQNPRRGVAGIRWEWE